MSGSLDGVILSRQGKNLNAVFLQGKTLDFSIAMPAGNVMSAATLQVKSLTGTLLIDVDATISGSGLIATFSASAVTTAAWTVADAALMEIEATIGGKIVRLASGDAIIEKEIVT